jgi:hypothetical protein
MLWNMSYVGRKISSELKRLEYLEYQVLDMGLWLLIKTSQKGQCW